MRLQKHKQHTKRIFTAVKTKHITEQNPSGILVHLSPNVDQHGRTRDLGNLFARLPSGAESLSYCQCVEKIDVAMWEKYLLKYLLSLFRLYCIESKNKRLSIRPTFNLNGFLFL